MTEHARRGGPRRRPPLALMLGTALTVVALASALPEPVSADAPERTEAAARAAAPGVPAEPTVVYQEDFEAGGDAPVLLTGYTGAAPTSMTYTADPKWLSGCNGWVIDYANSAKHQPGIKSCTQETFWNDSRALVRDIGRYKNPGAPDGNTGVTAFTYGPPGANKVQFATERPIPLPAKNRFLTFAVTTAARNCFAAAPLMKFSLVNGSERISTSTKPLNPCTDSRAVTPQGGSSRVLDAAADTPYLFTGDQLGIEMVNAQGTDAGNDHAFDDIRVLDVTPQVDKAFADEAVPSGGTTRLTFTVTNTSDLLVKKGWSFTDTLPAGMTVATAPDARTTCANGAVTATPGGTSVRLKGDLDAGQTSCTLSVDVTAPRGEYENCAENVGELVGVNAPGCATVRFADPRYTITKTSSPADGEPVALGAAVDYTVVVENPGDVPVRATVSDDLTAVLDDADYNADAKADTGTVAYARPKLDWSGTLAPGAKARITYSVTTKQSGGDRLLTNTVTGSPQSNCPTGTETGCTTSVGTPSLEIVKTADRANAKPGEKVTYTVVATNAGKGAYRDARITDDLTEVLDDAAYGEDAGATSGEVAYAEPELTWRGDIAAGGRVTLTYSVTVKAPDAGDQELANAVTGPPGSNCVAGSADPDCSTTVGIPTFDVAKTVDRTAAKSGDKVAYTLTVTNTGKGTYTGARFTDDLGGVLDDAAYNDDATATSGEVAYSEPKLSWKGDIPEKGAVTVRYSVDVDDPAAGDRTLGNTVTTDVPGGPCPAGGTDPDCGTTTDLPALKIEKTADTARPRPGDTVTYTVTVENDGKAAYPGATFTDDLSALLDDAEYQGDAAATSGEVAYADRKLTWEGDLAEGAVALVTYSVKVKALADRTGDGKLDNQVVGGPGSNCPADSTDPDCRVDLPSRVFDFGDAPDSYGTTLRERGAHHEIVPGLHLGAAVEADDDGQPDADTGRDTAEDALPPVVTHQQHAAGLTRTIPVTNTTGEPAVLAGWIDVDGDGAFEATEAARAAVADGATEARLSWDGLADMKPGTSYLRLRLFGDEAAAPARRATADIQPTGLGGPGEVEDHRLLVEETHLSMTKTAAPASVEPGGTVTYTVAVTSDSTAEYTGATFTDDLTEVLDDADYNADAEASAGTVTYAEPELTWNGTVPAGGTVTVTYSVAVASPLRGDGELVNAVTGPGGSTCAAGSGDTRCATTVDVVPPASPSPTPTPTPTPSDPAPSPTPTPSPSPSSPSPGSPTPTARDASDNPRRPSAAADPSPHARHALPDTGSSSAPWWAAAGAVLALTAGGLLTAAARRRHRD
ncbi:GEVED domain-containing protein [Streptomyces sp. NPDC060194]|uniref:DUF7927 domain-containing protein n=1 Tax=Streptomyces sp. NPDC060194 TaxID=3347069 RepID=UPI00365BFE20